MKTGVQVGVYNSRGVHARAEGGDQERALAEKYRDWSRKLAFEYPYVANDVGSMIARPSGRIRKLPFAVGWASEKGQSLAGFAGYLDARSVTTASWQCAITAGVD